ncbi:MAG: hypothetical protein KDA68_08580 [Planctomycetaceae bacterium]|nr:hypothetical protein [Planctomycetaceae bacterium]
MPFDWLKSLRRRCIPRRGTHIRRRNAHLAPSTTPCEPRILNVITIDLVFSEEIQDNRDSFLNRRM